MKIPKKYEAMLTIVSGDAHYCHDVTGYHAACKDGFVCGYTKDTTVYGRTQKEFLARLRTIEAVPDMGEEIDELPEKDSDKCYVLYNLTGVITEPNEFVDQSKNHVLAFDTLDERDLFVDELESMCVESVEIILMTRNMLKEYYRKQLAYAYKQGEARIINTEYDMQLAMYFAELVMQAGTIVVYGFNSVRTRRVWLSLMLDDKTVKSAERMSGCDAGIEFARQTHKKPHRWDVELSIASRELSEPQDYIEAEYRKNFAYAMVGIGEAINPDTLVWFRSEQERERWLDRMAHSCKDFWLRRIKPCEVKAELERLAATKEKAKGGQKDE